MQDSIARSEANLPPVDVIVGELIELAKKRSQIDREYAHKVAQLLARSGEIGLAVPAFLSWQVGVTPAEAMRSCRLAKRLSHLPKLDEAFGAGSLSEGTVDTLVRVATPDNEDALLRTAKVASGAQLQRLVRHYRECIDRDGEERPVSAEPEETFSWHSTEGMFDLHAKLRIERGMALLAALDVKKDADRKTQLARVQAGEIKETELSWISGAEALVQLSQDALSGATSAAGLLPDRYMAVVVVDEARLGCVDAPDDKPDAVVDDTVGSFREGGTITRFGADQAMCSANVSVLVKQNGVPVTITEPQRLATTRQRMVLYDRDKTCRFPGCGQARYVEPHHIIRWIDGGPTSLDNLVLLCNRHHHQIHQSGWSLRKASDNGVDDDDQVAVGGSPPRLEIISPFGPLDERGALRRTAPDGSGSSETNLRLLPGGERFRGTGERMTEFATDVILHNWLTSGNDDRDCPDPDTS